MRCVVLTSLLVLFVVPSLAAQEDQPEAYEPPRDYGVDWRASVLLEYSSEDGLLIGGGPILYKFGFRKLPYVYRMQLVGGVALKTGALKFEYTALYPAISGILSAHVLARFSEVEVRNFYGLGNDSKRDRDLDRARLYRLNSRELVFSPMVWLKGASNVRFGAGFVLKRFTIRNRPGRYLWEEDIDLPGAKRWFLGGIVSAKADTRDREIATTSGVFLHVEGASFPDVFKNEGALHSAHGDARAFFTAKVGIPVHWLRGQAEREYTVRFLSPSLRSSVDRERCVDSTTIALPGTLRYSSTRTCAQRCSG